MNAILSGVIARVMHEPVMTQGLVVGAVGLGTSFGLGLDAEQVGALTAFSAVLLSWLTRKRVSPV
jgi:hypothetical protein